MFLSCGKRPRPKLPTLSIRFRPTMPELFAKPLGNDEERELSNKRADSQVLAPMTKARAWSCCSVLRTRSMYETLLACPCLSSRISRAMALVNIVSRPVAFAGGSSTWLELKLDALVQPRLH